RNCPCDRASRSTPSMTTLPAVIVAPFRAKPSRANARVLLPEPDSPTTPMTSPRPSSNPTSRTMWSPAAATATVTPDTAISPATSAPPVRPADRPGDRLGDQVAAQRHHQDQRDRRQHRNRRDREAVLVLADHPAPVRRRGSDAEPEVVQRRDR